MKKALILALFLIPSMAFASFDVDLHYGSKGDDVVALQEYLTDQGVYTGPISGNFYSLTLTGVRKFQKLSGISPISGYVGPITRGVINAQLAIVAPDTEGDATITVPVTPLVPSPIQGDIGGIGLPSIPVEVPREMSPSVDIKVNGRDGPISMKPNGCIVNFVKTCATVDISWSSTGTVSPDCGVTGAYGWGGNYGIRGEKGGIVVASTTIISIQCATTIGQITDSVIVILQ